MNENERFIIVVYRDGDKWCVLCGDNIQVGICGFGDTVAEALAAFQKNWERDAAVKGLFR